MVTVDGDTSTNDMVLLLANGAAENPLISEENEDYKTFVAALKSLCIDIAKHIAHDGEGASKFLEINIKGAPDFAAAKTFGMAIAHSPLVKTAFFGEDPNWGRIVCALGYAGSPMSPEKAVVSIGDVVVYEKGLGTEYDADKLKKTMHEHDIVLTVELNDGTTDATVWTCDLTYEYVKINGEYHT
jgi:glutamate N-acetyltransferase/amino-acid N-acetyltransferase